MTKRRSHPLGRTGVSCYQKHQKTAHRYSSLYENWRNAIRAGFGADRAAHAHDRSVEHLKSEQWIIARNKRMTA